MEEVNDTPSSVTQRGQINRFTPPYDLPNLPGWIHRGDVNKKAGCFIFFKKQAL